MKIEGGSAQLNDVAPNTTWPAQSCRPCRLLEPLPEPALPELWPSRETRCPAAPARRQHQHQVSHSPSRRTPARRARVQATPGFRAAPGPRRLPRQVSPPRRHPDQQIQPAPRNVRTAAEHHPRAPAQPLGAHHALSTIPTYREPDRRAQRVASWSAGSELRYCAAQLPLSPQQRHGRHLVPAMLIC